MRSAKPERNTEPLCAANRNIGAELAWRLQQSERENVRRDDDERAGIVRLPDESSIIINRTVGRRILHQCAEDSLVEFEPRVIVDLNFDAERFCARAHDFDGLRMAILGHEESFPAGSDGVTERHRFGCGRCFIEQ